MVLQRYVEIPVWGWADPGESLTVSLAGVTKHVVADAQSHWRVSFAPLYAGGPFTLEVRGSSAARSPGASAESSALTIKDILIGEVWIASGQSNMTYALSGATGAATEIPKANDSSLRFFTVPKNISVEPLQDTLTAAWEVCASDTAKKFSAVAYFFARDLRRSLGVPVGIILSSWPGTMAEEWTDQVSLHADPILQPIFTRWDAFSLPAKEFQSHGKEFNLEFDDFELVPADPNAKSVSFSNFDDGSSVTSTGGSWTYSWDASAEARFELIAPGRGGKGYAAKISGRLNGFSDSNWDAGINRDGSPFDASAYSGVRFWARGQGSFQFHTLQPSIYDWDNYSAKTLRVTSEWKQFDISFKELKQAGWGIVEPFTPDKLTGIAFTCLADVGETGRQPSGLFNAMIAPLLAYPIRGAIWYQGEGNTYRAFQYRNLLPAMIRGWRKGWNEPLFPFLIVQLPNQGHSEEFGDSWWAELREAQLLTAMSVSNVGLAVTIDVGEGGNLHPPRKEEVGARLALWALGSTYGKKIEYVGPLYEGMRAHGREIAVRFTHTGSGLMVQGDVLRGFTLAGADKKFHRATARIEGDSVIVSSDEVTSPAAVRYAWGDSPDCNLYNKEGLPASPFRTDDWPGATFGNR
jgi:sialate O-acetylesterase